VTATDSGPSASSPALGTAGDSAAGSKHREGGRPAADKPSVELPPDAVNWRALIQDCDAKIKDLEKTKKIARGHLEQMMGDAELGLIDGRPAVHWTVVASRRLDQKKLKEQAPELVEACTVTSISRRFTLATGEDQ
jgi:predicted phage-related endonuclease